MDILHISDLHVTSGRPGFESLEDAWIGPSAVLRERTFDFIVVSGDLSQEADSDEYTRLLTFVGQNLMKLLRVAKKSRIIFVPGNHDVQWKADITDPIRLASFRASSEIDAFGETEKKYRRAPRESDMRFSSTRFGHFEWLRLKPAAQYQQRFANVQKFLDDYYEGALKADPHRHFDLLNHEEGKDWSCHVFPEDGEEGRRVAFFGFNSCHRNDAYWRGAHISRKSLRAAQAHASTLRSKHEDILAIAVWHHGLAADQGSPDYLSVGDVGYLSNCGFRVGFHGHTHVATNQVVELLRHRIAVLSTGTLAADASERPDAVGNQFSLVKLYHSKARIDVYQRDGRTGEYTPQSPRFFMFGRIEKSPVERSGWGKSHHRWWTISDEGIIRGEVTMEGFDLQEAFTLAQISPPYCNVTGDEVARLSIDGHQSNRRTVTKTERPDGRVSFTVDGNIGPFEKLTWGYDLSNAVALTAVELEQFLPDRAAHFPHLDAGWDARVHTVRFNCEQLKLTLTFEGETRLAEVKPIAEEAVVDQGEQQWRAIPWYRMDCELHHDLSTATLTVDAPSIGSRYGIMFRPQNPGKEYPREAMDLGAGILEACRSTRDGNPLALDFTNRVGRAVFKQLHPDAKEGEKFLDGDGAWTGSIWQAERRRLLVAFGEFPPESWAARFAAGAGVA
jgi:predicted phosphodiesterase